METKEIRSEKEFQRAIKGGVVLVDFNAPWCAPCRTQEPILEQLAVQFKGKALIAAMNVDENQETAVNFGIRNIPTLILFKDSQEVRRFIGVQQKNALSRELEQALGLKFQEEL